MYAIRNIPFDEIEIGRPLTITRTLSKTDIEALAFASGDLDTFADEAEGSTDEASTAAVGSECLIAHLLNRRLPGPGTRILAQDFRFSHALGVGDEISATLTALEKHEGGVVVFACSIHNQAGEAVLEGRATVRAPTSRIERGDLGATEMIFRRNDVFARIVHACAGIPPVLTAVVHPCDRDSLLGAVEAARRDLIVPVLVGPEARIRAIAEAEGVNLGDWRIVSTEHSHAAAARAVELARAGEVDALMKGSLHTDELMGAVVATATGLRTARRVSHVFLMDVPAYPRMLLVTDAAINIAPDARTKADIAQNAIDLAHVLGVAEPKLAVLAAVETVNPDMPSTVDAAMLCKMADRGQITGALIDGPLAFDNAVSEHAARTKHIVSPVAGRADILLVPDLESGNMVAKQLQYLAGADSAGIVLGARVPIALTSRADNARARMASAAVMKLLAHARRKPGAAR